MTQPISLQELSTTLKVDYHGDGSAIISGVTSLERLQPGAIVMVESQAQLAQLQGSKVGAVLHPEDLTVAHPGFSAKNPRVLLAKILQHFHPPSKPQPGIHDSAAVDSRAEVDPTAFVGPFCVVGPKAKLGPGVILRGFVVIGEGSTVGEDSVLQPHVVVGNNATIGRDCQLEAWSKLGDNTRLGDSVDLGAHTNLAKDVVMEAGVKADNLVLVGPRSEIGAGSLLVAQSAVDRDAKLHSGVIVAGQGSVGPEAVLHSGVQIGGRGLALGELREPGPYIGQPAIPLKEEMHRRARARKAQRNKASSPEC
jgi:UDP-3-O-[3-hydroxymyristoyl] glucosamine N-acyltransferase